MQAKEIITAPRADAIIPSGVVDGPSACGALYFNVMDTQEIWKDVPEFEGIYQISSFGKLKSFKKDPDGRILSNVNKKGGYLSVVLKSGTKTKYTRIHNLMVLVFWEIKTTYLIHVHHMDENKQNNRLDNFEILTSHDHHLISIQNNSNAIDGMVHYNKYVRPIPILQFDLSGNFIEEFKNGKDASLATGVCHRNIMQVACKTEYKPGMTRKQAGGYVWELQHN